MPRTIVYPRIEDKGMGRRVPDNFDHVVKFPARAALFGTPISVEKSLPLPYWHWSHDQGSEGACVGFGTSMMQAIRNGIQRREARQRPYTLRYDPWWLWDQAKIIDPFPETNPGDSDGTLVSSACEVMRTTGLVRYRYTAKLLSRVPGLGAPKIEEGIEAYRWATTTDEIRSCIAENKPVSIGVNWYENFYTPKKDPKTGEYWIGKGELGPLRGGHCVCIYGASDRRQAFRVKNSWGSSYPLVWLPYTTMARLLRENGEAVIITDR